MAGLKVNTRDIKRIRKLINQIPENYKEAAKDEIRDVYSKAVVEAKNMASRSTYDGELVAGIALIEKDKTFDFVSAAPHAPYVEFGTRSKVYVPSGWERFANKFRGSVYRINRTGGSFKERVKAWAKRKGLKNWFFLYKRIAKDGMGDYNEPHFVPSAIKARERLVKRLSTILKKSIGRR